MSERVVCLSATPDGSRDGCYLPDQRHELNLDEDSWESGRANQLR